MSQSTDRNDSMIGLSLDNGRFIISRLIGEGGMGKVFEARQTSMNRRVAIKILRRQLAADTHLLDRFEREALSISRLRHPNTITIYEFGKTDDGSLYMAMELLGGTSLYALLREQGPLPLARALHIFEQVCSAVSEAHELGIVHRDLKPENIQIDRVGGDADFAKVLDFGIAKIVHGEQSQEPDQKALTLAGAVFGTPHYMSPEQVHGTPMDHRTDIYSLGVILFELLAGRPPFDGATPMAVMMAQANQPPPDLRGVCPEADVTESVAELIMDCMAKDPDQRPATTRALLQRVQQIQYELGEVSSVRLSPAMLGLGESPPAGGGGRRTPIPAGTGNARPTPDYSGQLDSLAPGHLGDADFPDLEPSRRPLLIGLSAAVLVGAALTTWWLSRPGPEAPVALAPERIQFVADQSLPYHIESSPPAFVYLGSESQGMTPWEQRLDPDKAYRITLRLDGYQPLELDFEPNPASKEARTRKVTLVRDTGKPKDWVRIDSEPRGAEIYRGANLLGLTPYDWRPEVTDLPVELRLTRAGHPDTPITVNLQPAGDAPRPLTISLRTPEAAVAPEPPKPVVASKPPPIKAPASKVHRPVTRPTTPATRPTAPASHPSSGPASAPRYEKL